MLESMLTATKRTGDNVVIDISWKGAGQGSKDIIDKTGRNWVWQLPVTEARVVGSDRGPVWVNIADRWARTPVTPDLELAGKNFTIEFEFKPRARTFIAIGGTSDNNQGRTSGISVILNQHPATWCQAFIQSTGSSYYRLMAPGSYEENWVRCLIKRVVGVGFTMELYHDDIDPDTPFGVHQIGDVNIGNGDGYWYLFALPNSPGQFWYDGYLNFYRVTVG